ncbi:3-oxoacyl-ACP reductase [Pseudonocardia sp. CA-107938]|uniref:3-oxoacyl-ACP reductase n=1 Tax=Pseudonocardia sp. CA-107938 TaxID=3240021 RepID=UPI003D92E65D
MSNDLLRDISQFGLVQQLGVPRIPVLRRHEPGAPLLDGPALVGAVGAGRFAEPVRALLKAAGIADAGDEGKLAAVVLDASAVRTIDELAEVQQFLTPTMRRLQPCGRVLLIAPEPDDTDPEAAAVAHAFDGLIRSIGKELRAGATANLLVTAPHTDPAALDPSVRFFLSGRSAYVDGQVVHVTQPVGEPVDPAPVDDPALVDKPLAGRIAAVTGAARGIGAAVAETLARDGATVVAIDVPAAGEALAKVANRIGGTALQLDITAPDAPQRLVTHLKERYGRVDVVVHNAGITRDKLLANMDADRWNAVLAVNLRAQLAINAALGDVLSSTGRIVCVASTSGIAGNRGQTNYAASKAGVIGMVRALAPQLAERGVTINAVAPGFIETEMTAKMPLGTREAGRRINSLRQGGLPVDVAETIGWLARAENGGVTGQTVRVCGQSLLGA